MRQNILNGKWFIKFTEATETVPARIAYCGQILGEAADGWFYVAILNAGLAVASKRILPVAEFEFVRFFDSETKMIDFRRQFEKPPVRR